jgi:hypothetical protein
MPVTYDQALAKLKSAVERSDEKMNIISDQIKEAENILKTKNIGFTHVMPVTNVHEYGFLKWKQDKRRIIYLEDGKETPLIECKFWIRKMMQNLTSLIASSTANLIGSMG